MKKKELEFTLAAYRQALWRQNRRLEQEREELDKENDELIAERDDAVERRDELHMKHDAAWLQVHKLDAENGQLKAQLAALRSSEEPGQDPEYVVRYRQWDAQGAAARNESIAKMDARRAARQNRDQLLMHQRQFSKPRKTLWADLPWSPLKEQT